MYQINNSNPRQMIFCWGEGCSFAFTQPTLQNKYESLKYQNFYNKTEANNFFSPKSMQQLSAIYQQYTKTKRMLEAKSLKPNKNRFSDSDSDQCFDIQGQTKSNLRQFLVAFKDLIKLQITTTKNQLLIIPYLTLTYFITLKTKEPDIEIAKPPIQNFVAWIKNCNSLLEEQHQQHSSIIYLLTRDKIEDLIEELQAQKLSIKQKNTDKVLIHIIIQLLYSKRRFYKQNGTCLLSKSEFKLQHELYIKKIKKKLIATYFPNKSFKDPLYLVIAVLSGDHEAIVEASQKNWRSYILLYLLYRNPLVNFNQIYDVITQYTAQHFKQISQRELMLIYLTYKNFHPAYQYSLSILPVQICATLGLVAYDMQLLEQEKYIEIFDMSYRQHILSQLVNWFLHAEWNVFFVYFREYILEFRKHNLNYETCLDAVVSRKIIIKPVGTLEEYQQLMHKYEQLLELDLLESVLKSMGFLIKYLIKQDSFEYLFNFASKYNKLAKDKHILNSIYKDCLKNKDTLNFQKLTISIQTLSNVSESKRTQITKLFQLFILLSQITNDNTPEVNEQLMVKVFEKDTDKTFLSVILTKSIQLIKYTSKLQYQQTIQMVYKQLLLRDQFISSNYPQQYQQFMGLI